MPKRYNPKFASPYSSLDELIIHLNKELRSIADSINSLIDEPFTATHKDFTKHKDGMLIYADGTNFNPGAGRGLYLRNNGAWEKL